MGRRDWKSVIVAVVMVAWVSGVLGYLTGCLIDAVKGGRVAETIGVQVFIAGGLVLLGGHLSVTVRVWKGTAPFERDSPVRAPAAPTGRPGPVAIIAATGGGPRIGCPCPACTTLRTAMGIEGRN